MPAIFADLADAITSELAARFADSTFGAEWAAVVPERSYADWSEELKGADAETVRVDVVPVNHDLSELISRGSARYEIRCDIGIRKRFASVDQETTGRIKIAEIDKLVLLVEDVFEHLCKLQLSGMSSYNCNWLETRIVQTFSRKMLRENRQFMGIMRTVYRIVKAV